MSKFLLFLTLCFSQYSFAKVDWTYKAFPLVLDGTSVKVNEPSAVRVGSNLLVPLMSKSAGTHLHWGVEQVFLSPDLKRSIFVKYNVEVSSQDILGSWIKMAKGHVLHLKQGSQTVAYLANGFNNVELYQIQKTFTQKRSSVFLDLNPFVGCAYADEVKSGDDTPSAQAAPSGGDRKPTALTKETVGNALLCVGSDTISAAVSGANKVWENTSIEGAKNAAKQSALAVWDGVKYVWDNKGKVVDAAKASGQFLKKSWEDPSAAWNDVTAAAGKTKDAVLAIATQIAKQVKEFFYMSPEVQAEVLCHVIKEGAKEGLLALAMSATGVGAAAGAAKLALAVGKMLGKVKPLSKLLEGLSKAKDITQAKAAEMVRKLLRGEMTPDEAIKAAKLKAPNDRSVADAAGKTDAPIAPASTKTPEQLKAEVAALKSKTPEERIAEARSITDDNRIAKAEEALGKKLTPEQRLAIKEAHEIGGNRPDYDYDAKELKAKMARLKEAGLSNDEIKMLQYKGITGGENFPPEVVNIMRREQEKFYSTSAMTARAEKYGDEARRATYGSEAQANYKRLEGESYLGAEKFKEAERALETAGQTYLKNGKIEEARDAFVKGGYSYEYTLTVPKEQAAAEAKRLADEAAHYASQSGKSAKYMQMRAEQARHYLLQEYELPGAFDASVKAGNLANEFQTKYGYRP